MTRMRNDYRFKGWRSSWTLPALAGLAVIFLCVSAAFPPGAQAGDPVRIVDDLGQTVELPQPAARVIPLYGAFAEMLYGIGAGRTVVARTQADEIPPEILKLPSVGTHMRPNVEMIVGLKPDLVVQSASRRAASPEMERLRDAGIPVAVFAPRTFEGIFSTMERLGVLTGESAAARSAVSRLRERLDEVKVRIATAKRKPFRVFFEIRAEPLAAAGGGSMVQDVLTAAGAENVIESDDAVVHYNFEALLADDPDFYIVQSGPMNRNPLDPQKRQHFTQLRAVREGRVLFVDELLFSRPGPRAIDAAAQLASALYPEHFQSGASPPPASTPGTGEKEHGGDGPARGFSKAEIYHKLIKPLFRLSVFIAIGLFLGNLVEVLGWTRRLGMLTRPLLRWGHLNDHTAVSFMAAFFSGVTANTLLMNAHRDGKISRRELYLATMLNTLPSYFLHLPTTLSILIPLVRTAGVFYLAITLLAAVLRTFLLLVLGRRILPEPVEGPAVEMEGSSGRGRDGFERVWRTFRKRFVRVLKWTLPIYTVFFLVNHYGWFERIEDALARTGSFGMIPVEALSIVATQVVAEFTAGVAAAGALLDAGTLGVKETVLALLIGNIISTPVRALRHQLPYYMGIFTPRLGLSLLTLGQVARAGSILLLLWLFYLLFPA